MASWLKAAEDLLEVVDRRAKLVVGEQPDSQLSDFPLRSSILQLQRLLFFFLLPLGHIDVSPLTLSFLYSCCHQKVPGGQEVKARRKRSKEKSQSRHTSTDISRSNPEQEKTSIQLSTQDVNIDRVETSQNERPVEDVPNQTNVTSIQQPTDTAKDTTKSDSSSPRVAQIDEGGKNSINVKEDPVRDNSIEITHFSTNDDVAAANSAHMVENSSAFKGKEIDSTNYQHTIDTNSKVSSVDDDASLRVNQVRSESENVEVPTTSNGQDDGSGSLPEPTPNLKNQQDHKSDSLPMKVQEQLEEAQGLLKSAVSTGQSKEARLARVCAGLSSRLQEYKMENAQLEELLVAERERTTSYEARIKKLQQDLSASKLEVARAESNTSEALAAKNSEIESLRGSVDALKKQAAAAEGKLASVQENMEAIMRNRELTETRMMQALREELASAERRAEEERVAHNATKMGAVEREVELEHRAVEASNALARFQRIAEESTSRATELEHKVALLEVECASLTQELQDMEARNRRGQKKASEEAGQILQMQAWQEEVERARHGQRDAEHKLSSLEAELQKMRVEMAAMKRDADHYSRQEHMELEKRYRELTDLLYHKQTQLEAMASEKAAAEFHLEKEVRRLQEAQVEAERSRVSRRSSSVWEEDADIKAIEPLPLHHRHMAAASIQLQRAAKLLDSGAVRATRFLWRYPIARILLLFYLVFVHLFLMYLLHRLQEQADDFSNREVAASMGLGNSSLP